MLHYCHKIRQVLSTPPPPIQAVSITDNDDNSRPCERGFQVGRRTLCKSAYFNSRPCERGFVSLPVQLFWAQHYFNSRPCERGFIKDINAYREALNFNSRPCERGFQKSVRPFERIKYISIHAPARGASENGLELFGCKPISIHAPARGASKAAIDNVAANVFQFTPLREGLLYEFEAGLSPT